MQKINLGQTLTILANLGVIAGIGVLVYELRQSHSIALSGAYHVSVDNRFEIGNAISTNAEVWVKGNSGEPLDPEEAAIFSRLVMNLNDAAYFTVQVDRQLGLVDEETIDHAEFALYLYRNPGAYRAWLEREEDLATYRSVLNPNQSFSPEWKNRVQAAISAFREYDEEIANE